MIARTLNLKVLEELSDNMTIDQLVDHLTEIARHAEISQKDEDNSRPEEPETPENK